MSILDSQKPWIQGGPLLEVSFLIEFRISGQDFIEQILTNLKKVSTRVEVVPTDIEIAELEKQFATGYPFDEKDPKSVHLHSVSIPAYVHFEEKRKAYIRIQKLSEKLANISIDYFGSVHDTPEWGQSGIKDTDLPVFIDFLRKLFDIFEFPVGTVGIEYDSKDLFAIDEGWPNSGYDLANLDFTRIKNIDDTPFICILLKKNLTHRLIVQQTEETEKYILLQRKALRH